jgi:hypothetical protein
LKNALLQAKDAIIQSKDDQLQAEDVIIQSKDGIIQSKDDQLQQAKDAQLRLHPAGMASFNADSAAVGAARLPAHAQAGGGVAADSVFLEGQRLCGEERYSDAAQATSNASESAKMVQKYERTGVWRRCCSTRRRAPSCRTC